MRSSGAGEDDRRGRSSVSTLARIPVRSCPAPVRLLELAAGPVGVRSSAGLVSVPATPNRRIDWR